MQKFLKLFLLSVICLFLINSSLNAQSQRVKAEYAVQLVNPDRMLFAIGANFEFPQHLDSVIFKIADTDNHYTEGYAQFVKQFTLFGPDSVQIEVTKKEPNLWIAHDIKGKYQLKYILPIQHLRTPSQYGIDETPFYIGKAGVLIGSGVIIYPVLDKEIMPRDFEINFVLGENMVAVLPQKSIGDNRFIIPSMDHIFDAFWAVGAYDTLSIGPEGFPLRIAMQRMLLPELNDQLMGNLRKVWYQLTRIFGDAPHFEPLLIISRFPFSMQNSEVLNAGASSPGSISILLDHKLTAEGLDKNFGLFAYNLFPQWIPISFQPANQIDESWLIRGASNYYQLLLLRRIGLMTDQEFLERLAAAYEQYSSEFDRIRLSVRAARDISAARGYIFSAEMITACMFDLRLRSMSPRTSSLDQVFHALTERFSGKDNVFSAAHLFELTDTLSGQYLMPFVDSCINVRHKMDLPGMLEKFGVKLESVPEGKIEIGAAFASFQDLTLDYVQRGGPASDAELEEGDIVLKVDGRKFKAVNPLVEYLDSKKTGDKIEVEYQRGDETYKTKLVLEG
ncbi:MAG: PDZ domain-containing protein, partial [Aliifodinibius sp.]|nr:PDZ domain-containing protein [candidate division Zixibacteria bacterium]NIT56124.1 PDZ domain-containing protein [Fodinibius sp.]NIW42111.1 PDZ domain-containing protein [candidate division Zixibacteria bacterium]NIX55436.1 PDZ domain-containing protein [candidate division Zixibacteria bacterium]NIY24707.1 PDZ domain-containing protein [Fodinibius sp.]